MNKEATTQQPHIHCDSCGMDYPYYGTHPVQIVGNVRLNGKGPGCVDEVFTEPTPPPYTAHVCAACDYYLGRNDIIIEEPEKQDTDNELGQ